MCDAAQRVVPSHPSQVRQPRVRLQGCIDATAATVDAGTAADAYDGAGGGADSEVVGVVEVRHIVDEAQCRGEEHDPRDGL